MESNFKKVHTVKDLAISTIILLAGIVLFFINKGLGITIAVCGLVMFFLYKGGYRKEGRTGHCPSEEVGGSLQVMQTAHH